MSATRQDGTPKIGPGTDAPLSDAEKQAVAEATANVEREQAEAEANAALAEWLLVANAVSVRDAIAGTVSVIRYIREHRTHEHRINPNTEKPYPNAKGYIKAMLKPYLSDWSGASKDAFILMLVDEGFTVQDSADIVSVSKSKADRAVAAADKESTGDAGAPQEPSTLLSRTVKALERLNSSSLDDVDKFPTAGFKRLITELRRATADAELALSRRNVNRPHSGTEGNNPRTATPSVAESADKAGVKVTPATMPAKTAKAV